MFELVKIVSVHGVEFIQENVRPNPPETLFKDTEIFFDSHIFTKICHQLSENYVGSSDLYIIFPDCQFFILTFHLIICYKINLKMCSCPISALQITTKFSDKAT